MQDDLPTQNRRAGLQLKRLREAKGLTQRELERETIARYGEKHAVVSQQISRIEKGQIDKPPILDLIEIGDILGLDPGQLLELYGLWKPQKREELDPVLRDAVNLHERLPADLRALHLGQIEFANLYAAGEARKRIERESAALVSSIMSLPDEHSDEIVRRTARLGQLSKSQKNEKTTS